MVRTSYKSCKAISVKLRRSGKHWVALCPFRQEKDPPSPSGQRHLVQKSDTEKCQKKYCNACPFLIVSTRRTVWHSVSREAIQALQEEHSNAKSDRENQNRLFYIPVGAGHPSPTAGFPGPRDCRSRSQAGALCGLISRAGGPASRADWRDVCDLQRAGRRNAAMDRRAERGVGCRRQLQRAAGLD